MEQVAEVPRKFPIHPAHPERICWGCDKFCAHDSLACGNGSERTQHPVELFGEEWFEWGLESSCTEFATAGTETGAAQH
jgi:hypothetical protein